MSCEEYQASQVNHVENVLPCPQCGLQLTKGDGCSNVNCVCGKNFGWNDELSKFQRALSLAFGNEVAKHGGRDEADVADVAAWIHYHQGLGGTDETTTGESAAETETDTAPRTTQPSASSSRSGSQSLLSGLTSQCRPKIVNQLFSANRKGGDELGVVARAAAWSENHERMLTSARSKLFEEMVMYK
jgi:hypothetical protein